ncbi:AraC family transcriptional regulator [Mycolicibacterium sp. NCC-Tsukiji]|uniref:helix-turn-helix domain-containing protein n=1 Tax=Mycobacteriaceae TaxID=1762 RepID=UPI000EE96A3F|nr:AraC family transcriptional regulator [Mycolicibacterium sp. NCC-Tsukiji]GCB00710.1 putative transcriptional regulator, AraC family protein [Mycolicibacterium sp. NCC-Tsukiji]
MPVWELGPAQVMVVGTFGDLEIHHHPAVQIGVGLTGPLTVRTDGAAPRSGHVVVIASGAGHAVWSAPTDLTLALYLAPHTWPGAALHALSQSESGDGIWLPADDQALAQAVAAAFDTDPELAAATLIQRLCGDPGQQPGLHPQLKQAMDLIYSGTTESVDLASIAHEVAVSPDYLGRLCRQQTGVSFSAATRWARLLSGLKHLAGGEQVTDAAHLAGFADGSHANRVCREMTGAAPSEIARALRDSTDPSKY